MTITCHAENCNNIAKFASKSNLLPEYCEDHRQNYKKSTKILCEEPNCDKIIFKERKCEEHYKRKGICQYADCKKYATYGKSGSKLAEYCKLHKPDETYVNVKSKTCKHIGCKIKPNYGKVGSKLAEYCVSHKPDETYVDIVSKICKFTNCKTRPFYGKSGSKLAEYCVMHKPDETYVDIKNKTCKHANCKTIPTYGKSGSKLAEYCVMHKPDETYVDIKNKTCKFAGCKTRPSYGKSGSKLAEYCAMHKPDETYVDIKNKTCKFAGCKTLANYGIKGYSSEYCAQHKNKDMVLRPSRYKNAEKKKCEFCETDVYYLDKFCSGCKIYISNGNKTVKRKNKELEIKSLLEENEIKFTHDLIVKDGCSRKRPDFVINTAWGIIILEVDEFQHNRKTYSCECEISRMKQLYFDCGVENLLFIRYNPDDYKVCDGDKQMTDSRRREYLSRYIQSKMRNGSNGLAVVYLFYDLFVPENVEIEPIDAYEVEEDEDDEGEEADEADEADEEDEDEEANEEDEAEDEEDDEDNEEVDEEEEDDE